MRIDKNTTLAQAIEICLERRAHYIAQPPPCSCQGCQWALDSIRDTEDPRSKGDDFSSFCIPLLGRLSNDLDDQDAVAVLLEQLP